MLPRPDHQELAAIFAGGVVGALARSALARGFPTGAAQWPWATFAVNIAAALMLGYFITRLQERLPPYRYPRAFFGTGLCGALSTFSTLSLELLKMIDGSHWGLAVSYASASALGGLAAVFVSTKLVRRARL